VYAEHPHTLLPLETSLPAELQYLSRTPYRTVLTMILSVRMADVRLTQVLGRLFAQYPDFDSLKGLSKSQLHSLLRAAGVVLNDPERSGNGARLWGFLQLYFGPWGEHITAPHLHMLRLHRVRGFGEKVVRLLHAYCLGNQHVLPLDTPAFAALQAFGLYTHGTIADARTDIEQKLSTAPGVSLIDFHELLRFRGQAGRITDHGLTRKQKRIIVGWNAWRLLISAHGNTITHDWIRHHLVQSDELSADLWDYVRGIAQSTATA
jgi:endonuclease III